jgi:SAM-dependent methyltransferase
MGSKNIQGALWGQKAEHWAQIQEPTGMVGYEYVLDKLGIGSGVTVLDVGCGTGVFSALAYMKGADVTGIDAAGPFVEEAKKRVPGIDFLEGEMEALPFEDKTFDVVCGFNSFQYAENIGNAFAEAKRALKDHGKLAVMIWGNKEDCEAATYLKALGGCMPPPPPGAGGPFALTENNRLQAVLVEAGFKVTHEIDLASKWDYPDKETAMNGFLSAGPAARAISHSGYDKVYSTVEASMAPYVQPDGRVIYQNKFRVVLAEKA